MYLGIESDPVTHIHDVHEHEKQEMVVLKSLPN